MHKTILVVEDHRETAAMIQARLKMRGTKPSAPIR